MNLYGLLDTMISKLNKTVKAEVQSLTSTEQKQVRDNIGAAASNHTHTASEVGAAASNIGLSSIYPVGSIYMSVNNVSPASFLGGTWTQIAQGRTLFGADGSEYIAGNTVEAGLPNITGSHSTNRYSGWEITGTGAFAKSTTTRSTTIDNGDNNAVSTFIATFDASSSNSIYGKSNTVQPPAFIVYMWRRTA